MGEEEYDILHEEFAVYPGRVKFGITLTNRRIRIAQSTQGSSSKNEEIIMLDDVTGCHVLQARKESISSAYLCVFSYPLRKKKIGSGVARQRVTRTFTIDSSQSYKENLVIAEIWKMTIKRLVAGEVIRTKEDTENGALATRNLLVLVNPFSGRKKATTMYKEKVKPMLLEAEIKHTVRKTEYPGHAKEIAKDLKLEDWDGIVIVSGDGLVHEVINGLMDRTDWEKAIQMPIGIVPGGSGNALAASIVYASTGQMVSNNFEIDTIFEILKGKTRKMSLAAIETEAGQKYYSFLNFAWGFIADVDIESERFRKLGPVRFTLGCALRVASMRLYHGRISYLPAVKNAYSYGRSQSYIDRSSRQNENIDSESKSSSVSYDRRVFGRSISKRSKEDAIHSDVNLINATTTAKADDVFHNSESQAQNVENGLNSVEDEKPPTLTSSNQDNEDDSKNGRASCSSEAESNQDVKETSPEEDGKDDDTDTLAVMERPTELSIPTGPLEVQDDRTPIAWKDSAIVYHLRASFDEPAPDDWAVVESEFVWVTSVYLSHIGNEMMGIPEARMDDDIIYVYTLRKGISKAQMVSVLLGFENGTHIEKGGEFSCVIPCRAVRLEPLNFITGHMTVDGELAPHCSIQASITPHKVNIMSSASD